MAIEEEGEPGEEPASPDEHEHDERQRRNRLRAALGCEGEVAECVHGEEAREEREREQVAGERLLVLVHVPRAQAAQERSGEIVEQPEHT